MTISNNTNSRMI